MKNNVDVIREKWADGQVAIGTGITFSDSSIIELLGEAGLDLVFIDLEHGSLSLETAKTHVMVARGAGLAAFIRVASFDPVVIKPVIDLHPAAIVVPRILDSKQAAIAVAACKYPPKGIRGFSPIRGMRYGGLSQEAYFKQVDDQTMVIVQIEEASAVEDIDAILTTPGLDAIMVGPNDLSGSLGFMGQHDNPEVVAAIDKTIERARTHGIPVGVGAGFDTESVRRWIEKGLHWMTLSADWFGLYSYTDTMVTTVRKLENEYGKR